MKTCVYFCAYLDRVSLKIYWSKKRFGQTLHKELEHSLYPIYFSPLLGKCDHILQFISSHPTTLRSILILLDYNLNILSI
jgi:hypothetical protein